MTEQQVLAGTDTSVEAVALRASTLETFRATLRGTLLRPGDAEYDAARKVWNGTIDRLRIDPIEGKAGHGGQVEIDWIALFQVPARVVPLLPRWEPLVREDAFRDG